MVTSSRHRRSPSVVSAAVREAARFDRRAVSAGAGVLAAIPVVAVLSGGIIAGKPVWGVTMGAGAMLVGIAWRTQGGRPPLAVMATDTIVMATSTFVCCITGSVLWVHLLVLCLWGVMGEVPALFAWQPPDGELCLVAGEPATLLVCRPDYDATNKAWVRLADGIEHITGGSQVQPTSEVTP